MVTFQQPIACGHTQYDRRCRLCWKAATDEGYQRRHGLPVGLLDVEPFIGEDKPRVSISDMARLKRQCREKAERTGEPCQYDKKPDLPPIATRHLCYHIWPKKGSSWRQSLDHLRKRVGLFNGRRLFGVVTGPGSESVHAVRDYLFGVTCEIFEFPNDPALREVVTFKPLMEQVAGDKSAAIFWGHAKGVNSTQTRWGEMQESALLDYWPAVERHLQSRSVVGCFRKIGKGLFTDSPSAWHYSGGVYWMRADSLGNWRECVADKWHGTESWPGVRWAAEEGACLFGELDHNESLYKVEVRQTWERRLAEWQAANVVDYAPSAHAGPWPWESGLGDFYRWLSAQASPRLLETGTLQWEPPKPGDHKTEVLAANPTTQYVGTDISQGRGVDVACDLHELAKHFPADHFDAILSVSTFEHLAKPWIAVEQLRQVLRTGGLCLVGTHQTYPVHGYPSDYFRFTEQALRSLFDSGWKVLRARMGHECRIVPLVNECSRWNFQAPAYLTAEILVEKL